MQALDRFFASQLGRPRGAFGRLVMARILTHGNATLNTWTSAQLGIRPGDRALDLGCGPGTALAATARQAAGGFAAGLDYAPAMVAHARRENRELIRQGRAGVVQGDASALPFAAGCFTVAYAVNVIYFWPDPRQVLREVHRVLGPGGRLAIATRPRERIAQLGFTRYGLRLYSDAELRQLLIGAGFTQVRGVRQPVTVGMGGLCTIGRRS